MANQLKIELVVDDKGTVKIKQLGQAADDAAKAGGRGFDDLGKKVDDLQLKLGKSTDGFKSMLPAIAALASGAGALGAAMKIWDMAKAGAGFEEQRGMLDNLSRKYKTTADTIVSEMDRASKNQIAKADLMGVALAGISKGLNPEQLIKLADAAETLGDAVGKDATTALKELTEALETGRTKGLKGYLGTALDLKSAFGDLESKMTEVEKAQAMYAMTMEAASGIQKQQTRETDDAADKIAQVEKRWKDATLAAERYFKTIVVGAIDIFSSTEGAFEGLLPPMPSGFQTETPGAPYVRQPMPARPVSGGDASPYKAQLAALKEQLQARKDDAGAQKEQDKWLKEYLGDVDRLWKAEVERSQGLGELAMVEMKWKDEAYKKDVKDQEAAAKLALKLAGDRATAYKDMASEMAKAGDRQFEAERDLLNERAKKYQELGIDEVKIMEWLASAEHELNRKRILEHGNFFEGVSVGLEDLQREFGSFYGNIARFGAESARDMHSSISDVFYDGMHGKMDSLSAYWDRFTDHLKDKFFRMTADIAAEKVMMLFTSAWAGDPSGTGSIESILGIDVPFLTFAGGGRVPGSGQGDTVPAMLTPGEYVLSRNMMQNPVVSSLVGVLDRNSNGGSSRGGVQHFAGGGRVMDIMGHDAFEEQYARYIQWHKDPRTILAVMQADMMGDEGYSRVQFPWATPGFPVQYHPWSERPLEKQDFNYQTVIFEPRGSNFIKKWMPPVTIAVTSAIAGGALGAGAFGTGTQWSSYGAMANASYVPATASAYGGAAAGAGAAGGAAAAEASVWSKMYEMAANYVSNLGTNIWDSMLKAWEMIKDPSSIFKNFDLFDTVSNIPSKIFDRIMNWDLPGYLQDNVGGILSGFKLGLSGMGGGQLLDTSAMAQALGIGQAGVASYATGTGPSGLPRTGLFYGHQGEIVQSKTESDRERSGRPTQINVYLGNELIHSEIRREADTVRVKAERRNRGTRRTFS